MFLRNFKTWKERGGTDLKEPVARFLKSYAVFISDHTGKEDIFFDMIEEKRSLKRTKY